MLETVGLVTFTEETFDRKLFFLCSEYEMSLVGIYLFKLGSKYNRAIECCSGSSFLTLIRYFLFSAGFHRLNSYLLYAGGKLTIERTLDFQRTDWTSSRCLRYQKQPSKGVLKEMCSENMQQVYGRTPKRKWISRKLP